MKSYPVMPGVPAAGHVTARGYWHSGGETSCGKCHPPEEKCRLCRRPVSKHDPGCPNVGTRRLR